MGGIDYKKIKEKVRISWENTPWKKILTFSFCIILSAIFWFMEIYRKPFTATYTIPIQYSYIPDSVVFESVLPENITVNVRDDGYGLFQYFFTKSDDSIEINVSDILKFSSSKILQGNSLEQIIKDQLLPTSEIVSYTPNRISFYYSPLQHKRIPIIFDGIVFLAPGYLLNGDIRVVPDSVSVYGPREVLSDMNYAYTVNDTVENFKSQNEVLSYPLKEINNVRFLPERVDVTVPIDRYTQKDVLVPIICINLPDHLDIKFFPSSVKVSFLVGLSKYHSVTANDFSILFDYNDLKGLNSTIVPVQLSSYPDYVQNIVVSPSDVEFIFEQK